MKRKLLTLFAAALALASCTQKETPALTLDDAPDTFYAYAGESAPGESSRTIYAKQLLWSPGNEISVFTGSDANKRFVSTENQSYSRYARFTRADDDFYTAKLALDANYAVYPYDASNQVTEEGVIRMFLREILNYNSLNGRTGTFGEGDFPMVAVTENRKDQDLFFKNLCGVIIFNMTGTGRIHRIVLEGNNGEVLNGWATVTVAATRDSEPSVAIDDPFSNANKHLVLNVYGDNEGILDPETPTEFWMVVPPTVFEQGITVHFFDEQGNRMTKTLSDPLTIARNQITPMGTLEFVPDVQSPFQDAAFADFCLRNYDTDYNYILSEEEMAAVDRIDILSSDIRSLAGIEAFPNLAVLNYDGGVEYNENEEGYAAGVLTGLDITGNPKMTRVTVRNSQLFTEFRGYEHPALAYLGITDSWRMQTLNVSGCTALERLYCYDNQQLTQLHIENTPALKLISASRTQISALTTGSELAYLYLDHANLSVLDLTASEKLLYVSVRGFQGAVLDLSHNPLLYTFYCESAENLTSLDFSAQHWLNLLNLTGSGVNEVRLASQPSELVYDGDLTINYVTPTAPTMVDLGLASGKKWATCNLGAADPIQTGYCYRWGMIDPAKPTDIPEITKYILDEESAATYGYPVDGLSTLQPADDAATVALGDTWHTPTSAEWQELIDGCDWTWSRMNEDNGTGKNFYEMGWLGTSKANGNTIFLPAVGYYSAMRQYTEIAYLWTADLNNTRQAKAVAGNEERAPFFSAAARSFGLPIRPVHD